MINFYETLKFREILGEDEQPFREAYEDVFNKSWGQESPLFLNGRLSMGAFHNNELCGFFVAHSVRDQADILTIGVKKKFQSRGIGGTLLEKGILSLETRGVKEIFLEVAISNIKPINLYKKYGFTICAQRKNYYTLPDQRKEDAYTMKLKVL